MERFRRVYYIFVWRVTACYRYSKPVVLLPNIALSQDFRSNSGNLAYFLWISTRKSYVLPMKMSFDLLFHACGISERFPRRLDSVEQLKCGSKITISDFCADLGERTEVAL